MWYFTVKLVYKLILRRSYCEMNSCRYSMRHKSRSQAHKNVDYFQPYKYVFFANTSFLLSLPLFLLLEKICCKFNDRQILFHVWLRYLHWYTYYCLILNNVIVFFQKFFKTIKIFPNKIRIKYRCRVILLIQMSKNEKHK